MSLAATVYVLYLLPDSLLRLLLWISTNTLYRLDVQGRENVPARGGALLTPNHVSMADAVLLIASIDRPIRFLMFRGSYEHPLVKPFAKIMGVIPIASDQGPREMIHSLRLATAALKNGEVVCIFPEGQMTRIRQMLPFRRGMERIIKGVNVPIIPVNLFFFSSRRRHTRFDCDWSSDVCSSDLRRRRASSPRRTSTGSIATAPRRAIASTPPTRSTPPSRQQAPPAQQL